MSGSLRLLVMFGMENKQRKVSACQKQFRLQRTSWKSKQISLQPCRDPHEALAYKFESESASPFDPSSR